MKVRVKFIDKFQGLVKEVKTASFKNLGHAGASIRKDAAASVVQADGPSPWHRPPHTHRKNSLKRAIRYEVGESSVVVGPTKDAAGESAAIHEFGETYKGVSYPKRPFMGPALERATPRLGGYWKGTLGG